MPKSQREHHAEETASLRLHMAKVVTLSILVLTGMSLVSQTKVIKTNSLQAAVYERMTQTFYDDLEAEITNTTTTAATAALPPPLDPGKYPPFSCSRLLTDLKTDPMMQRKDPNRGVLQVRRTVTEPPFYIALHNRTFDTTRWA